MKGFGFVGPDQGGKDIFVHATALERSGIMGLAEGQRETTERQTTVDDDTIVFLSKYQVSQRMPDASTNISKCKDIRHPATLLN
jgi:cold shock CspA family protein